MCCVLFYVCWGFLCPFARNLLDILNFRKIQLNKITRTTLGVMCVVCCMLCVVVCILSAVLHAGCEMCCYCYVCLSKLHIHAHVHTTKHTSAHSHDECKLMHTHANVSEWSLFRWCVCVYFTLSRSYQFSLHCDVSCWAVRPDSRAVLCTL